MRIFVINSVRTVVKYQVDKNLPFDERTRREEEKKQTIKISKRECVRVCVNQNPVRKNVVRQSNGDYL